MRQARVTFRRRVDALVRLRRDKNAREAKTKQLDWVPYYPSQQLGLLTEPAARRAVLAMRADDEIGECVTDSGRRSEAVV